MGEGRNCYADKFDKSSSNIDDATRQYMLLSVRSGWFVPKRECGDYRGPTMRQNLECLKANGVEKICFHTVWPDYPLPVIVPTEIFVFGGVSPKLGPWPEDVSRLRVVSLVTAVDLNMRHIERLKELPRLTTLKLAYNHSRELNKLRQELPNVKIEHECMLTHPVRCGVFKSNSCKSVNDI
eukprot:5550035-Prymnesium_polylepis.1